MLRMLRPRALPCVACVFLGVLAHVHACFVCSFVGLGRSACLVLVPLSLSCLVPSLCSFALCFCVLFCVVLVILPFYVGFLVRSLVDVLFLSILLRSSPCYVWCCSLLLLVFLCPPLSVLRALLCRSLSLSASAPVS